MRARPAVAESRIGWAAALPVADVVRVLDVAVGTGLTAVEAALRLARYGRNTVSSHRARFLPVLWRQVHSPLLVLLLAAALASYFVGGGTDALIIAVIDAG